MYTFVIFFDPLLIYYAISLYSGFLAQELTQAVMYWSWVPLVTLAITAFALMIKIPIEVSARYLSNNRTYIRSTGDFYSRRFYLF